MPRIIEWHELSSLVGREIGVSDWLTVDQALIDRFADVTGDRQWIHVDRERALRENGGTIAHGFLTLSLLPVLTAQAIEWRGVSRRLNYGLNRLRFTNVVRVGHRIRLHEKLTSAEPKGPGVLVTRECTIEIEGEERPALVTEWVTLAFP